VKRQQFELSSSNFNPHDIDGMIDFLLHIVFLLCVLMHDVTPIIIIIENVMETANVLKQICE